MHETKKKNRKKCEENFLLQQSCKSIKIQNTALDEVNKTKITLLLYFSLRKNKMKKIAHTYICNRGK